MKKTTKILALLLALAMIIGVFAGCGKKEKTNTTESTTAAAAENGASETDIAKIVSTYAAAYDKTKAAGTFLGKNEKVNISNILIKNEPNSMLEGIIGGIVKSMWKDETNLQLPPYRKANADTGATEEKFMKCLLTADDVQSASMTENADGTYTINITPKDQEKPVMGEGPQGKSFNVYEEIMPILEDLGITFTDEGGSFDKNVNLTYSGGTINATYDPATGMLTSATYIMNVHIGVVNVKFYGIKMEQASLDLQYKMFFPE